MTRLDTPPRTSPPKFIKPKRPHTYHATTTTTTTPSIYEDRNDRTTVTEAIDDIERQLLIKTVVHRQYNSNRSLCDQEQQQPTKVTVAALNWPASTKSKRNLNSILGRFNRNSSEKDIKDIDIVTARFIERERPPLIVEPSPPRHASPTAKRSSHLDDCRVKKSKKSARLSSCIPYCTRRHEPSDGPSDSLASSFHLVECCTSSKNSRKLRRNSFYHHDNPQRQYLIDQLKRLRSSNELIASNTSNRLMNKRGHQQQPQQGQRGGSNNNSNLFNNLNIMDRSVDSIGSCSLDVDAESTDFSGSTPLSHSLSRTTSYASALFMQMRNECKAQTIAFTIKHYFIWFCSVSVHGAHCTPNTRSATHSVIWLGLFVFVRVFSMCFHVWLKQWRIILICVCRSVLFVVFLLIVFCVRVWVSECIIV